MTSILIENFDSKLSNMSQQSKSLWEPESLGIYWDNFINRQITLIVVEILQQLSEELDANSILNQKTETYVYENDDINNTDDAGNGDATNFVCHHPLCKRRNKVMFSSINLDNTEDLGNNACQVEVVDNKMSSNLLFGSILTKTSINPFTLKCLSKKLNSDKYSLEFLLKIDKISDDLVNLLHNHKNNKVLLDFQRKEPLKDRRLLSIEQSVKCTFDFPADFKIVRYKGVNCIRLRIISNYEINNVKALNLLKVKIPKLYNECIFNGPLMRKENTSLDFSIYNSPVRRCYVIERPTIINDHPLITNRKKSKPSLNANCVNSILNSCDYLNQS